MEYKIWWKLFLFVAYVKRITSCFKIKQKYYSILSNETHFQHDCQKILSAGGAAWTTHTHTHSLKFAYRTSKIWKVTEQNHQDYASLLYAYKKGVVTEMLKQVCPGQNICPMFRFIDRTPFGAFVLPYFTLMPISLPKFSPNNDQTITGRVVPFDAFVCLFLHTPIVANYQQKKTPDQVCAEQWTNEFHIPAAFRKKGMLVGFNHAALLSNHCNTGKQRNAQNRNVPKKTSKMFLVPRKWKGMFAWSGR